MTDSLTIALAQLNPTVGDIDGNVARIRAARLAAGAGGDSGGGPVAECPVCGRALAAFSGTAAGRAAHVEACLDAAAGGGAARGRTAWLTARPPAAALP